MLNIHIKYYFLYYPSKHSIERDDDEGRQKESGIFFFVSCIIAYKKVDLLISRAPKKKNLCTRFNLNRLTMLYCGFVLANRSTTASQNITSPLFYLFVFFEGLPRKRAQHNLNAADFLLWIIFHPLWMHFSFAPALAGRLFLPCF